MSTRSYNRITTRRQNTEPIQIAGLVAKLKAQMPGIEIEAFNKAQQLDMDECTRAGVPDGYWLNSWEIFIGHHPEIPEEAWFVIEEGLCTVVLEPDDPPVGEATGYVLIRNGDPVETEAVFERHRPQEQIVEAALEALTAQGAAKS